MGNFLDPGEENTTEPPISERPGDTIGPYKLLQQIGEGGMGVVYMAEQAEPIERRVALKIIKPGMDTKQVIARFEAERQAMALMDHPNIAKALDAGVTGTGRPFFVMELVKGLPITKYCDEHKLTPRQRLELMIPVCQAIQHAHHKGIIHRDIKPSNVLVAHYDDQPVPKVIDFGVAKAIDHRLTEKTMFTQFGQVLGTFEYMSPEQARLNQWDVDTRTDVYSLGVLLYELLTGSTPFDRQRLRSAAFGELLRIIREEDPPRPSTKLSASNTLPTIAASRQIEPAKLSTLVRGELDWIVMRALDKDRTRRYETANGLGADIQRHLDDEPVVAGPPLARYRLAKFVKRNKVQVVAGVAVAVALVLALVGTSIGMVWALRERSRADLETGRATAAAEAEAKAKEQAQENEQRAVDQKQIAERELARANEIKQLMAGMLLSVNPEVARDADTTLLRRILDRAARRLAGGEISDERIAAELHGIVGNVYIGLGLYSEAEKHYKVALETASRFLNPEDGFLLNIRASLGVAYLQLDRLDEAESLLERTLKSRQRLLGQTDAGTLIVMHNVAILYKRQNRLDEAESLYKNLIELETARKGENSEQALISKSELATVYYRQGQLDEAEKLLRETLDQQTRLLSHNHPKTLATASTLGLVASQQGRLEEAEAILKDVIESKTRILTREHPDTLMALSQLGDFYRRQNRFDEAEVFLNEAIQGQKRVLPRDHYRTLHSQHQLAHIYRSTDRAEDARALFEELIDKEPRVLGYDHKTTLCTHQNLIQLYFARGNYGKAGVLADRVAEIFEGRGSDSEETYRAMLVAADCRHLQGHLATAEKMYQQAITKFQHDRGDDDELTQHARAKLADIYRTRANRLAASEDWDLAAANVVKLIKGTEDSYTWYSPRKKICRGLARTPEVFRRVAELIPEETTLWIGRAQYHAQHSRWQEAANDYSRILNSRSLSDEAFFEYAGSLLLIDDQEGYQRLCNKFAEHLAQSQESRDFYVAARACSLGPADNVTPQQAVEWAAKHVQDNSIPWRLHTMGLSQYRAGQLEEAINSFERSNDGTWGNADRPVKALNWIVMAMCHQKAERTDKARECYDKATTMIKPASPKPGEATSLTSPDWIEWHVLKPQANELLNIQDDESKPLDSSSSNGERGRTQ